jgi:hypothetical protein
MQTDFYTIYDSKVDATLVWYSAHLPGFKKTHAYAANRSQDTFYNPEGTLAVSVTGSSGKADENTETYSVVYSRFQPAKSSKETISPTASTLVVTAPSPASASSKHRPCTRTYPCLPSAFTTSGNSVRYRWKRRVCDFRVR